METNRSRLKSEEDDIYAQIKSRLEELAPKNTSFIYNSPRNDVPGPGHYSIKAEASRTQKISFPIAPRFTDGLNNIKSPRRPSENSESTLIMKSMSTHSIRNDTIIGEFNNVDSIASERSATHSKLAFLTQHKHNSKANTTQLRGSFPKAPRKLDLSIQSPSLGPVYKPVLSPTTSAYSFGRKLSPLNAKVASPGPGSYRPEACKIESKYTGNRGAVILKGEKHTLVEPPKDLPQGPNYYLYSHYTSFNPAKAKGPSLGYGSKYDFVTKSQKDIPGPGAYTVTSSLSNLHSSQEQHRNEFPSLGRPNDTKHFKEFIPGPGEYNPVPVVTSPSAKIGTSKRPGHFDPKKEIEVAFSEEKMKRLMRLEKRLTELAALAEKKSDAKRVRRQIKKRILLFEELAKANLSPGFVYNITHFQIGKNTKGAKFGKDTKDGLGKQLKEKIKLPGPAEYDVNKADSMKQSSVEGTFGNAKRPEIFVKYDSENIPGVGNYDPLIETAKKGGMFTRAKKGLNDSRTEERWEQAQQGNTKTEDFYTFIENLDSHLEALFKKQEKHNEEEYVSMSKIAI